MELAVMRGCDHYRREEVTGAPDPGESALSNVELAILLLLGEMAYEPNAIRIAAQLLSSVRHTPSDIVRKAIQNRVERPLSHIARAGCVHDKNNTGFWQEIIKGLGRTEGADEPHLPHYTRFISSAGYKRGGGVHDPVWLRIRGDSAHEKNL
ncbi:hypothetical protein QQ056_18300 [Oscillatoria laete-virens NRMC-F 0139]|nr:hypothetical protein [Oscillatoria laete-virens]MDL5055485.1 hypothetical protein [Oscillatoria laete-virens NRMC-F 0139]